METKMWLLCFLFCSGMLCCNSQNPSKEVCENQAFYTASLANKKNILLEGSNITFFKALENSDFQKALVLLKSENDIRELKYNGYTYFEYPDSLSVFLNYKIYRLMEYIGETNSKVYFEYLMKAYTPNLLDNDKGATYCMNQLTEIEYDYLAIYSDRDSAQILTHLKKFKNHVQSNQKSLRIKFMWAKMNYYAKNYKIAFSLFNELLNESYYEKNIYETYFEYYIERDFDSLEYYSHKFQEKFPLSCNVGELFLPSIQTDSLFFSKCMKCFDYGSANDSIRAGIALGKNYLMKEDHKGIKNIFDAYKKNNTEFLQDDLKIWETGEYYDLFLRSLFLQKKYKEMFKFITKEVGYNKKININNDEDFYLLIQEYFNEYMKAKGKDFEIFWDGNFKWINGSFKT